MKRTNQSTKSVVIGLFVLSLTAFLYLNTRPECHRKMPKLRHATPTIQDSTKLSNRLKLGASIYSSPALQAINFIEETNELVGFHRWMSWRVDELSSWRVDELSSWWVDELTNWWIDELMNWWIDELTSWRVVELMNWRIDELMNWWVDELTSWRICLK